MRVTALVRDSPLRSHLEPLPKGVTLVSQPDPEVDFVLVDGELAESLPDTLVRLPRLRVVQTLSAGIDWLIPVIPEGVVICNGSGIHDASVAEWVVATLLNLQRRLPDFWESHRNGVWNPSVPVDSRRRVPPDEVIETLWGRTVLILGYGSIGEAVAARLEGFGVNVACVARRERLGVDSLDALPRLLPQADAVILLLPLTSETDGVVDASFLARMKAGAILINAGRGRLIRTADLIDAAIDGHIRAAVDVTEPEPLPHGHPLWSTPNVIVTPHIAGATEGWEKRGYLLVREQLRRLVAGEPMLNVRAAPSDGGRR